MCLYKVGNTEQVGSSVLRPVFAHNPLLSFRETIPWLLAPVTRDIWAPFKPAIPSFLKYF